MKIIIVIIIAAMLLASVFAVGYNRGESARRNIDYDKWWLEFGKSIKENRFVCFSEWDKERIANNGVEIIDENRWYYKLQWFDSSTNKRDAEYVLSLANEIKSNKINRSYREVFIVTNEDYKVDIKYLKGVFGNFSGTSSIKEKWALIQTEMKKEDIENIKDKGIERIYIVKDYK